MGVKGLWSLLQPVNRPIKIETLEGKRLAIDSSIWLYQFQATMKDKEGRTLNNAHILGFLRRINKLLFHGIKPVFVFDGVSPALKRNTIAERKQRKAGATLSHAKMAAKLLAAQLRSAAVKQARTRGGLAATEAAPGDAAADEDDTGDLIPADATFLDDFEQGRGRPPANAAAGPSRPRRVRRGSASSSSSRSRSPPRQVVPDEMESAAKKKYVAKDPYELPALPDKANGARANDPRLATDEELKAFIDESGIDVDLDALDTTSAEFQTLPRDTQYDIVNDLRLRSRAPNYHRLQTMLSAARTPLDFSKAQILNLQKRNQLSQQMWSMAGIDTKAFTISVAGGRVAGERGKEYVLVKNDGAAGGWVLGIRDEGTSDKPIELDAEIKDVDARKLLEKRDRLNKGTKRIEGGVLRSNKPITVEDEEEKAEMERRSKATATGDPELRELRRREALEAFAARYSPKKATSKKVVKPYASFGPARPAGAAPLFAVEDDEDAIEIDKDAELAAQLLADDLAMDLDRPKEEEDDLELARALEASERDLARDGRSQSAVQLDEDGWERLPEYDSSGDEMEEVALEADTADQADAALGAADGDDDDMTFTSNTRQASLLSRMSDASRRSGSGSAPPFEIAADEDDDQTPVAGPGPRTLAYWTGEDDVAVDDSISTLPTRSPTPPSLSAPRPLPPVRLASPHVPSPDVPIDIGARASRKATSKPAAPPVVFAEPPASQRHPPTAVPVEQPRKARPTVAVQPKKDVITLTDSDDEDMEPIEIASPPQPVDRVLPTRRPTEPASASPSPEPIPISSSHRIARSPTPPPRPLSPLSIARTFSSSSERPSPPKRPTVMPSPTVPSPKKRPEPSLSTSSLTQTAAKVPLSSANQPPVFTVPDRPAVPKPASSFQTVKPVSPAPAPLPPPIERAPAPAARQPSPVGQVGRADSPARQPSPLPPSPRQPSPPAPLFDADGRVEEDVPIEWSPSPPPMRVHTPDSDEAGSDVDEDELHAHQDGDEAADDVEEDNYASFLAGVKGKDLNAVQEELDAEVERLRKDKRKMTRDGDENITAQMVGQIQLLLQRYGIPYITAPSEAEAQCAALASLNLVDGIITDDSDVFLFGGKQCFKNLFNDHKYVECYVLSDFDRELCLNQERLVTLAFLLGSDYTAGVPGVGYVTAMEIMAEFPGDGDEGLVRFRNWWMKVQTGKDTEEDTSTKWKQSFKKKFKDTIHLTPEFPNPQVRPAYLHPQVDDSTEPFTWGLPNLHTLRPFLTETLQWLPSKVDEVLDPIIKRNDPATRAAFQRKQITLDGFFDASAGGAGGFFGGQKRGGGNGGASERLRKVVERMRVRDKGVLRKMDGEEVTSEEEEVVVPKPKKGKAKAKAEAKAKKADAEEGDNPAPKRKRARPLKAAVSDDDAEVAEGEAATSARGRGRGRGARARGRGRGAAAAGVTSTRKTKKKTGRNASPTPTPSPSPSLSDGSDDDAAHPSPLKSKRARLVQDSDEDEAMEEDEEAPPVAKRPRPKPKAKMTVREEPEEEEGDYYGAL